MTIKTTFTFLALAFAASAQVQLTKPADVAVYVEQNTVGGSNCQEPGIMTDTGSMAAAPCLSSITVTIAPMPYPTTLERDFQVLITWPDLVNGGNATLARHTRLFSLEPAADVRFFYPKGQAVINLTHVQVSETLAPVQTVYSPASCPIATPAVCPAPPAPVVCPVLPTIYLGHGVFGSPAKCTAPSVLFCQIND